LTNVARLPKNLPSEEVDQQRPRRRGDTLVELYHVVSAAAAAAIATPDEQSISNVSYRMFALLRNFFSQFLADFDV
jgi:hypothetical protein